jgi:Na+-translocating ferredoxin:NAD+ oxidoreductase subunit C
MTRAAVSSRGTFPHGIHPPERKGLASDAAIEALPTPAEVRVPYLMHVGAPCSPVVEPKADVTLGQKIADSDAFVSAPAHASVDGTVQRPAAVTLPNARHMQAVILKPAQRQSLAGEALLDDIFGGDWPTTGLEQHAPEDITAVVREAGIVGQGGAAFPTHVKLTRNEAKPIDTLLVNGCECEPYLTADYRMMVEAPAPIIAGALLATRATGASRTVIAVEDNKPLAVETLTEAARGTDVQVVELRTQYPQGGEKQAILASLNRTVPAGGLPLDVGVVVVNVGTVAAVARAVLRGKPLTHRVVTVTGSAVQTPKNLLAPVGCSYQDLVDACGGLKPSAARVLAGGPMMGFAIAELSLPVTKGTSGVVAMTEDDVRKADETHCVRCGKCVDVCPMNLVPTKLALASRHQDWDLARRYHLTRCIECGCCAYACPACLPLVQLMRMGKAQLPRE